MSRPLLLHSAHFVHRLRHPFRGHGARAISNLHSGRGDRSTGAVVPGANLTLTNPATGEKQVRVSNDAGVYNFNALPAAARFRLEVEKDGFQKKSSTIGTDSRASQRPQRATRGRSRIDDRQRRCFALPALDTETASINGVVPTIKFSTCLRSDVMSSN